MVFSKKKRFVQLFDLQAKPEALFLYTIYLEELKDKLW